MLPTRREDDRLSAIGKAYAQTVMEPMPAKAPELPPGPGAHDHYARSSGVAVEVRVWAHCSEAAAPGVSIVNDAISIDFEAADPCDGEHAKYDYLITVVGLPAGEYTVHAPFSQNWKVDIRKQGHPNAAERVLESPRTEAEQRYGEIMGPMTRRILSLASGAVAIESYRSRTHR
jgi:hypothetical protein